MTFAANCSILQQTAAESTNNLLWQQRSESDIFPGQSIHIVSYLFCGTNFNLHIHNCVMQFPCSISNFHALVLDAGTCGAFLTRHAIILMGLCKIAICWHSSFPAMQQSKEILIYLSNTFIPKWNILEFTRIRQRFEVNKEHCYCPQCLHSIQYWCPNSIIHID